MHGSHTFKGGFYNTHSWKAQQQNSGATFGTYNFGNSTGNPLDSGFGYANALLGVVDIVQPAVDLHRRLVRLQQHRGLHPGQLEDDQPVDAGLRRALRASAAAVRQPRSGVELPARQVRRLPGAAAVCAGLREQHGDLHGQQPVRRRIRAPASSSARARRAASARSCRAPGNSDERSVPVGPRHCQHHLHLADDGLCAALRSGL